MHNLKVGETFLLNANNWFYGPDGESYIAIFGTIKGIHKNNDKEGGAVKLQITIGNMTVNAEDVRYAIKCDRYDDTPPTIEQWWKGERIQKQGAISRIYNANSTNFTKGKTNEQGTESSTNGFITGL